MNLFERFLALLLIIVVTTACGTAKFQGNGANKSKNVDDRSVDPIICGESNPCPNPCEEAKTTNQVESASQNTANSLNPNQNATTATCPQDEQEDEDDASQNGDQQS